MKIFMAADHAGVALARHLEGYLKNRRLEIETFFPDEGRVDYPDYAKKLCTALLRSKEGFGILVCGSGVGMSISANRFKGIRAALCSEPLSAKMTRLHNDANVLCLGARMIGTDMSEAILEAFLYTEFEGGRHKIRIDKIELNEGE